MTDEQFKIIGLNALGDILTLKEFVRSQQPPPKLDCSSSPVFSKKGNITINSRKRRSDILKEALRQSLGPFETEPLSDCPSMPSRRAGRPRTEIKKANVGLRKVRGSSYLQVKSPLGDGGWLKVDLLANWSYEQIHDNIREVMFPDGVNPRLGDISMYETCIVNASNDRIDNGIAEFRLAAYIQQKKVSTVRFHLLCRNVETERQHDAFVPDHLPPGLSTVLPSVTRPNVSTSTTEVVLTLPDIDDSALSTEASLTQHTSIQPEGQREEQGNVANAEMQAPDVPVNVPDNAQETTMTGSTPSLFGMMTDLRSALNMEERKNIVNIRRTHVLEDSRGVFSSRRFDSRRCVSVRFAGEQGADTGGLTREFFRLLMSEIQMSYIFHGDDEAKMLLVDARALANDDYYLYAKMIAYMIVHGGPAPQFFAQDTYQKIVTGTVTTNDINRIMDPDLAANLTQVSLAENQDTFASALAKIQPVVDFIHANHFARLDKRAELVEAVKADSLNRYLAVVQRFRDGLCTLDVLSAILSNSTVMGELFIYNPGNILDFEIIDNLFVVDFNPEGSNKYTEEVRIHMYWRDFIQDLEEANMLSDLLVFVTGLHKVPPLGFNPTPRIMFEHPDQCGDEGPLPFANTCINKLTLPVRTSYEDFQSLMMNALEMGTTFTTS